MKSLFVLIYIYIMFVHISKCDRLEAFSFFKIHMALS